MVVVKGKRELRSFAVVGVQRENGCSTKYNVDSRLVSATPVSAAQKAFSRLCNLKRIRGKCTLVVTVVDTTQGARTKGKSYTYKVDRVKLAKPIILQKGTKSEYKIKYTVKARKAVAKRRPTESCGKGKSHGPMKKTTPRKNKQEEKKRRSMANRSAKRVGNNSNKKRTAKRMRKNTTKNNSRSLLNRLRMN